MKRRQFLKQGSLASLAGLAPMEFLSTLVNRGDVLQLTIMHTNDVHSRIDPFPMDGGRNQGQGGVARRKELIDKIRSETTHHLLLDAGDIFQGTPYFNLYKGELEIKLMSALGYDAATIGNHDFDAGIEGLEQQMKHAQFPFIISNYGLDDTILKGKTLAYKTWEFDTIKVGMYGLGIELNGLVPPDLYKDTRYLDPISSAQKYERFLKKEMDCDYIVCLSHLGYNYQGDKVSDVVIAAHTNHTDLIIGGHTHSFLRAPHVMHNRKGHQVLINQVGFAGIYLGKIDLFFDRDTRRKACRGANLRVV